MAREKAPVYDANGQAVEIPGASTVTLTFDFTLEQTRVLVDLAQRGIIAAAHEGGAPGGVPAAKAALAKLSSALEEAQTTVSVREELEQAGFQTDHLTDVEVVDLARRLAEIPQIAR
jgi:hypothetical protein